VKNFLTAIGSQSGECNGISGSLGRKKPLQWCTLQSGKSKTSQWEKANGGLILHGDRESSSDENLRAEISYFCNRNRRRFDAAFQFGGPLVEKCRDEVLLWDPAHQERYSDGTVC
jgi:hypothetical protein